MNIRMEMMRNQIRVNRQMIIRKTQVFWRWRRRTCNSAGGDDEILRRWKRRSAEPPADEPDQVFLIHLVFSSKKPENQATMINPINHKFRLTLKFLATSANQNTMEQLLDLLEQEE